MDKKVDNYSGYHNMVLRVSIMKNYVYNSIHCRKPSKNAVFCDKCVKINSQKWIFLLIIPMLSTSYPQNVDNVTSTSQKRQVIHSVENFVDKKNEEKNLELVFIKKIPNLSWLRQLKLGI